MGKNNKQILRQIPQYLHQYLTDKWNEYAKAESADKNLSEIQKTALFDHLIRT